MYTIQLRSDAQSSTQSEYGYWALSKMGRKGIHHQCADYDSRVTKCGRPITLPYWTKIRRMYWWPGGRGASKHERVKVCKRCLSLD